MGVNLDTMIMYFLEVVVDANVGDVLAFLEKENHVIKSLFYPSQKPDGLDMTVNFQSKCEDDTVSISTKIYTTRPKKLFPKCYEDVPDGQGNEVIRFEITRLTDVRSLVKGLYQKDNSDIELMFQRRLVRLGIAFGSGFTDTAQIRLNELEQSEQQWGWHESPNTLFGNKVRYYGPLPKQIEQQPRPSDENYLQDRGIMNPINIFISYAREDEDLMNKVRTQLIQFEREGVIFKWYDRMIDPGQEWERVILQKLREAQIVLLFVSSDFLASPSCFDEMQEAIRRYEEEGTKVISIILRSCMWKKSPLSKLQLLPKDGVPITKWNDIDDATLNVAEGIMNVVYKLLA